MRIKVLVSTMAFCLSAAAQPQLTKDNIKEVVAAMTLLEKAEFVVGMHRGDIYAPPPAPGMPVREVKDSLNIAAAKAKEALKKGVVSNNNTSPVVTGNTGGNPVVTAFSEGRVKGAAGDAVPIERLGITTMVLADGPAGLRIDPRRDGDSNEYYCTAFPTGGLLAASWDAELVERVTRAMGNEVKEYGADILLAPAMNIHRNPLCGRNFEYFSEDPLLSGKIAAAYVRGIQANGVGTSVKHFAANNQETYRNGVNVKVSERALREIYLRCFGIAVKEGRPWTVMSSYNMINGVLSSENPWLLNDVLRGEWGFDGFVMTDWWAEENGARQVGAGNDMLMPGTQRQMNEIVDAVRNGTLSMSSLDLAVENILRVLVQSPTFNRYKYSNNPDLSAHAAIAREAAAEGMVLLENNGVLPIGRQKVALLGVDSYDVLVGGSGSGYVNRKYKVSIYDGLRAAGFDIDAKTAHTYMEYIDKEKAKTSEFFWIVPVVEELSVSREEAERLARDNDMCILTIGRMAGEGGDRQLSKGDYYLSDTEEANLNRLCTAFHAAGKRVVVLLNMGNMIEMTAWHDMPDAVLHTWLPGQEAGNAVADVLTGKVSPSGKLPFTIAKRYDDYPSASDFPQTGNDPATVEYREGIFVGYRHFDKNGVAPLYPFGYGKSYTTFKYGNMKVNTVGDSIAVSLTVKNTGRKSGKEAVQLYVSAPADGMEKPVKELRAFAKTRTLKPGEKQVLTMKISRNDLASWSPERREWVIAKGKYTFIASESASAEGNKVSRTVTF